MKRLPEDARILIIKTHAIGDLLMATPAIRDLRVAYPAAHITLLTGAWSADAVRKNPCIDEILEFEDRILLDARRHLFSVARLLTRIRRKRFDAAVILHPSAFLHAFAMFAGISRRYGLSRRERTCFLTTAVREDLGSKTYYPVNYQRVAALAGAPLGDPIPEIHYDARDEEMAESLLRSAGIGQDEPYLVVAPGGGRNPKEEVAARRWPAERFADLLQGMVRDYPDLRVVITGGPSDAFEAAVVASAVPRSVNVAGATSLRVMFAIVHRARAVVCNDSSLLHIAVACRRPAVIPFGPTGLAQRVPEHAATYCVQSEEPCSPCYIGGKFPGCAIGFRCLREMPVATVRRHLELALAVGDH